MREERLLKLLAKKNAMIVISQNQGDTCAAIPYGDMRRRPIAWVKTAMLQRWIADGIVIKTRGKYKIVDSYLARLRANASHANTAHADQHRKMENKTVFDPNGLRRQVRINGFASVFQKLARRQNTDGLPFLSVDEIEAGERFARDYSKSMMGAMGTQSYGHVRSGTRQNSAENTFVQSVDAKKRVSEALIYVGPGLDKMLTSLCAQEWSLTKIEQRQGWQKNTGETVLKLALTRLSVFYGCKAGVRADSNAQSADQNGPNQAPHVRRF